MRNDISVVCTGGRVPGRVPGTSGARDGGSKTGASRDPTARASGSGKCVAGLGYTQGGKNGSGHVIRHAIALKRVWCVLFSPCFRSCEDGGYDPAVPAPAAGRGPAPRATWSPPGIRGSSPSTASTSSTTSTASKASTTSSPRLAPQVSQGHTGR